MLTNITIENFKSFSEKASFELAPITLLYGPNSAGKSSLLHSLLYLYEVIENRWCDVDVSSLANIDLGGYKNILNRSSDAREIGLAVSFNYNYDEDSLNESSFGYGVVDTEILEEYSHAHQLGVIAPCGEMGPNAGRIEIVVGWSELQEKPYVSRLDLKLGHGLHNDNKTDHVASIISDPGLRNVRIANINFEHYLLNVDLENLDEAGKEGTHPFYELLASLQDTYSVETDANSFEIPLQLRGTGAIPELKKPLPLVMGENLLEELYEQLNRVEFSDKSKRQALETEIEEVKLKRDVAIEFFSQVFVAPLESLSVTLKRMVSIGPIRIVPPRNYQPRRRVERNRWYDGIAAWDRVHQADDRLFTRISQWMFRLKSGYSLARADIRPGQGGQVILRDEAGNTFLPMDVGIGISQMFPMVVAVCDDKVGLLAVEQPELHIHPALQVELGDLLASDLANALDEPELREAGFAFDVRKQGVRYLIETHSEHILLRLLRRIRETTEGELKATPWLQLQPRDVSVIYIDRKHDSTSVKRLRIDEEGEFIDRWPKGFFAERAEELF